MTLAEKFAQQTAGRVKDRTLIEEMERRGFHITKDPPKERTSARLDIKVKPGGTVKIPLVSDTHMGSRFQQVSALTDFYRYCDAKGAQAYLHAGDLLEGHHVHRDSVYEQFAFGVDEQVTNAVRHYPVSKNGPTHFIDGNHDSWSFENAGVTSGSLLAGKRPDLKYLGYYSAWVEVGGLRIYLAHGSRGGGAYAKSYKPQKLIESMAIEDASATNIAAFGHWHQDAYVGRIRGMFGFMLPCFKAQDRFLRSLGKEPTIGGLMLEVEFTRDMKVWDVRQDWRYYSPKAGDFPGGG